MEKKLKNYKNLEKQIKLTSNVVILSKKYRKKSEVNRLKRARKLKKNVVTSLMYYIPHFLADSNSTFELKRRKDLYIT